MALALPAASVPPISVQTDEPRPVAELDAGHLAGREDHRRDGRDEQQLDDPRLGQRDVGADRVAGRPSAPAARRRRGPPAAGAGAAPDAGRRRRPGRVVARRRRAPTSSAQMTAPSARWSVCVQPRARSGPAARRRRPGPRTGPPRSSARRTIGGWSRCVRQATTATADDDQPDDRPRPSDGGRGREFASVSGGKSVPFISGQSGKTSAASVAVTCEPNSSSAKVAAAPNAASSVNRWLAPRPRDPGRVAARTRM